LMMSSLFCKANSMIPFLPKLSCWKIEYFFTSNKKLM